MATWKETLACVRDCIDEFEPGSLDRFACILDCYEEKAKQFATNVLFPEDTPAFVQTVSIMPNGKDNMKVFLLLLDLLPPQQFLCVKNLDDLKELMFNGEIIDLECNECLDKNN
ncbi:hypothetical protein [Bacillus solimangrovi]|uniref:Uncharacterized protein n=1 Tax=Bacillus solimangrovi TaxID=1305675 RepID=A0A1E5LDB3_9BACI|nr:hypothetical protein [Bacillus solimangrovi]OEH92078.1 hypothetical protein BFG57_16740 [Bacillus solimangrovi]